MEDRAEALRMIREGSRTIAAVMIWTAQQEHVINSHLSLFSEVDQHLLVRIPPGFDAREFEAALVRKRTSDCFFSISLVAANIFFKTKYKGAQEGEIAFELPETVYKVQRRASMRFPIPDGRILHLQQPDPMDPERVFTRKIVDISAGGLSFLVPDLDLPMFDKELLLHNLSFKINQRVITVDGQVRHLSAVVEDKRKKRPARPGATDKPGDRPGDRKDAWRIGIQFTGMRPVDNNAVAAYVFEESRKFFTRFA